MAGGAHATPAEGDSVRTELAKGTTDAPVSIVTDGQPTTLYVQSATLHPGAGSGWHTHPARSTRWSPTGPSPCRRRPTAP